MADHTDTFNNWLQKFEQEIVRLRNSVHAGKPANEIEQDLLKSINFAEQLDQYATTHLVQLKTEEFNNSLLQVEHTLFEVELELLERDGLDANRLFKLIGQIINLMTGLPVRSQFALAAQTGPIAEAL